VRAATRARAEMLRVFVTLIVLLVLCLLCIRPTD